MRICLGLYEKALPQNISVAEKLSLAKDAGFDYLEISIDETEDKLARLHSVSLQRQWLDAQRKMEFPIKTMCLSAHRKYPMGSKNPSVRQKSLEIMQGAIELATRLGVRVIQLAGYDVYYEQGDEITRQYFLDGLSICVEMAAAAGVVLAFETMETLFMNTVEKAMVYVELLNSPYLQIYPDVGNIRNATETFVSDMCAGQGHIVAAHLKETNEGVFRNLQFGQGRVDFDHSIQTLLKLGVRLFTCEFWYDGSSDPLAYISRNKAYFDGRFCS